MSSLLKYTLAGLIGLSVATAYAEKTEGTKGRYEKEGGFSINIFNGDNSISYGDITSEGKNGSVDIKLKVIDLKLQGSFDCHEGEECLDNRGNGVYKVDISAFENEAGDTEAVLENISLSGIREDTRMLADEDGYVEAFGAYYSRNTKTAGNFGESAALRVVRLSQNLYSEISDDFDFLFKYDVEADLFPINKINGVNLSSGTGAKLATAVGIRVFKNGACELFYDTQNNFNNFFVNENASMQKTGLECSTTIANRFKLKAGKRTVTTGSVLAAKDDVDDQIYFEAEFFFAKKE